MDTKMKIVDEAFQEFLAKGYKGADVVAIAQRAGVTKGGLNYYFRAKSDLAAAVLRQIESEMGSRISGERTSDLPPVFESPLFRPRTTAPQALADVASVLVRLSTEVPPQQKGVHARIESIVVRALDRLTLALQENRMNKPHGLGVSADELSLVVCSAVLGSVSLSRMCRQRLSEKQVYLMLKQVVQGELTVEQSSRRAG